VAVIVQFYKKQFFNLIFEEYIVKDVQQFTIWKNKF